MDTRHGSPFPADNKDGVMKHYFVLGDCGFSMSYSTGTGEWSVDKAEDGATHSYTLVPIEYIEYSC